MLWFKAFLFRISLPDTVLVIVGFRPGHGDQIVGAHPRVLERQLGHEAGEALEQSGLWKKSSYRNHQSIIIKRVVRVCFRQYFSKSSQGTKVWDWNYFSNGYLICFMAVTAVNGIWAFGKCRMIATTKPIVRTRPMARFKISMNADCHCHCGRSLY